MSVRTAVAILALTASSFAPAVSSAASLFGRDTNVKAQSSTAKMVKLTLHNKSAVAMTVLVNDAPVTLAANAEVNVRVAVDSNIYADDHTTVRVHVTRDLSGTIVSFQ